MQKKLSYSELLREIDYLRSKGVEDNHPKMRELKVQLWQYLEGRNKSKPNKTVPIVTAIKTITLDPTQLGENQKNSPVENKDDGKGYAKYFLLGIVVAIAMIFYKLFRRD